LFRAYSCSALIPINVQNAANIVQEIISMSQDAVIPPADQQYIKSQLSFLNGSVHLHSGAQITADDECKKRLPGRIFSKRFHRICFYCGCKPWRLAAPRFLEFSPR
jgi:hypothetical protein